MNDFYEENYQNYFNDTVGIDSSGFLNPLASQLKPGSSILDIGCGSGRDLAWFSGKGFKPVGFEKAASLVGLAVKYTGQPVIQGDFTQYDFSTLSFDALVLVGALVHLSKSELPKVLDSVCRALLPNGLILITLKEGSGTRKISDGRIFTLWSTGELEKIFIENNLEVLGFSRQISKLRSNDTWLGYVLRLIGTV